MLSRNNPDEQYTGKVVCESCNTENMVSSDTPDKDHFVCEGCGRTNECRDLRMPTQGVSLGPGSRARLARAARNFIDLVYRGKIE
jgi:hypothetical protein